MKIFVIIDGVGDLPVPALGGKTPLEAAHIPNLDWFAAHGKSGYVYSIREGVAPESDGAIIALLGYNVERLYTGRGPLEAYGAGVLFEEGSLVLRTNFATVDGDKVVDRRAGRGLTTKEAKLLEKEINKGVKLSYPFTYRSTVQHRGVIVVHGHFSDEISNIDPEYTRMGKIGVAHAVETDVLERCVPLSASALAKKSADIINDFFIQTEKVLGVSPVNKKRARGGLLPANALLLRDAGIKLPNLTKKDGWAAVVSMPLEVGIAKRCGMRVLEFAYPEMKTMNVYDNLYDGLHKAVDESKKSIMNGAVGSYYIHFKEVDSCGHDGRHEDKIKMLEFLDREFFSFVRELRDVQLIVTGDHSTPCIKKAHSDDPVPLLFYGGGSDGVGRFNEKDCVKGSLGKVYGKDVLRVCGF